MKRRLLLILCGNLAGTIGPVWWEGLFRDHPVMRKEEGRRDRGRVIERRDTEREKAQRDKHVIEL